MAFMDARLIVQKEESRMKFQSLAIAVLSLTTTCITVAAQPTEQRETVAPAFSHPIANLPGKTLSALVVNYARGAKTPAHRHGQSFVVGYVLEGSIRSKIDNGQEIIYRAGESWTEKPGAHHVVSENGSSTEPAKLLAIFLADSDEKDLVVFDKKRRRSRERLRWIIFGTLVRPRAGTGFAHRIDIGWCAGKGGKVVTLTPLTTPCAHQLRQPHCSNTQQFSARAPPRSPS
jgi:quercetin dioxygenase-like cupin family protein